MFFAFAHGYGVVGRFFAYGHKPRLRVVAEDVQKAVAPFIDVAFEKYLVEHIQFFDYFQAFAYVRIPNTVKIQKSFAFEGGKIFFQIVYTVIQKTAVSRTQTAFF